MRRFNRTQKPTTTVDKIWVSLFVVSANTPVDHFVGGYAMKVTFTGAILTGELYERLYRDVALILIQE